MTLSEVSFGRYFMPSIEGAGGPDPLPFEKSLNIGFFSNTGPDPLKNYKAATKLAFNVGPTSARQQNGDSLAGR